MANLENARLPKTANFSDMEKLNEKIQNAHNIKLQIPNSLKEAGIFGLEGAALQLFSSWLRKDQQKKILHTAAPTADNPGSFTSLCNTLFGLCCLRLSDTIWSTNGQVVDRAVALAAAKPIFEDIRDENFSTAFKGMYLALPAIKAPTKIKNREFDNPLYNRGEVIGAKKFRQITHSALSFVVPQRNSAEVLNDTVIAHLSEILRELFTNTHKHGRTDEKGIAFNKNFRAITFRCLDVSSSRLSKIAEPGGGNLRMFLAEWRPLDGERLRVLDITVVDSGPGYARRWTGLTKDQLTVDQEKLAVVECFKKNRSSHTADSSGSGLSNVLRDLRSLKGWFRLSTGRTILDRSFFAKQGSTDIAVDDFYTRKSFMDGVVFNIVIPLKSGKGDGQHVPV